MTTILREQYGRLFEKDLIDEIINVAHCSSVNAGEDLITPGQYIKHMPLLLKGTIKILRPDSNGDELLLYHLESGDTCAMSMTCCMGTTKSEIHAVTETEVELLMIPVSKMEEWSRKYRTWRNFVMNSYHNRLLEMLESIDNIAFNNMDERLEKYLEDKIEILNSKHVYTTHKDIASDLHTSRVVISRLLKKMEREEKIKLHRSFIEVL